MELGKCWGLYMLIRARGQGHVPILIKKTVILFRSELQWWIVNYVHSVEDITV